MLRGPSPRLPPLPKSNLATAFSLSSASSAPSLTAAMSGLRRPLAAGRRCERGHSSTGFLRGVRTDCLSTRRPHSCTAADQPAPPRAVRGGTAASARLILQSLRIGLNRLGQPGLVLLGERVALLFEAG